MKRPPSILLFLAALFCLGTPMLFAQTGQAPTFTLPTPDGKTVSLDQYKGQIVLLDFWAILCPPCRAEIPGFIDITNKYKDKGVVVLGLSLDKEAGKLRRFVEENKINYPILMATKEVQMAYGNVQAIPTTFLLDRNHTIVKKHVGFTEQAVFEADLDELLRTQPPPGPTTPAAPTAGEPSTAPASEPTAPATPASPALEATASDPASPTGQP
ncbi:MAG: Thiol:disulfide interchange protein [Candidatus Ozemobacter sibiricus]|jgi:peroxiredoxin|uniref:Thiol:disulfide interchange protein n=1 Tax=Candidatus Ozemobacter sibiricus TaxID=2268124 RepID=A0A367ZJ42_9BACT|nr:MAG: Thiol:disulfide interchange protein [Candidatus Ozemobacter sibiricus]